jgi:hypothetical protein
LRQYTPSGDIPIDGIEIDPAIVEARGTRDEHRGVPNLNVIVEDGRYALNQLERRYSVIGIVHIVRRISRGI